MEGRSKANSFFQRTNLFRPTFVGAEAMFGILAAVTVCLAHGLVSTGGIARPASRALFRSPGVLSAEGTSCGVEHFKPRDYY